ncbi:PREDICTED: uncharacterized protein LOC104815372 [Tarenaya hassleriana]|uniref:uncharacterized protein LOC104815372 n=1 Tax=Tarenaya hassleriana TaxID=28532 RepID=UPI00053C64EE|nr:PREDICTED: uncharacterized protein LOC104815372 [Tarenaya hassleriana]
MASKDLEDPSSNIAGTDEETVALRRKRLRRVSFADREITSVHIFNRDEDYETPPNSSASKQRNGEQVGEEESEDKVIRFFGELADGDDSRELLCSPDGEGDADADADDEVVVGKLFLRPKGSPSSGGSTVGSATTDDENFFGPVSAHFIRPGRLSGSAASEENHELTMDSTAFSMHFRSLVMSEPGDTKTPTSSHVAVEEKTPIQVTPRSDTGSVMVLTKAKKLFPKSPLPVDKVSGGRDSNDMSLVGDNSHKYDYARLSPTLEAMLAAESKASHPVSTVDDVKPRSPGYDFSSSPRNRPSPTSQRYKEMHGTTGIDACQIQTPDSAVGEPFLQKESGSQLHREGVSLSSSTSRRLDLSLVTADEPKSLSCVTPSPKQHGSFLRRNTLALVESLSSIQKSKSGFRLINATSPASALLDRIEKSKLVLSGYRSVPTHSSMGSQGVSKDLQEKHVGVPVTNLEDELSKYDNKTPTHESNGTTNKNNGDISSPAIDIDVYPTSVQSLQDVFSRITQGETTKSLEEDSFLKQQEHNHLVAENPTEETAAERGLTESVSLSREITFDFRNNPKASTPTKCVSPPENESNVKVPSSANNVDLDFQGQGSGSISKSRRENDNLNEECMSADSMIVASDKVHSLIAEAGSLLTETGFLDGIAQLKGEKSVLNEIQNTIKTTSITQSPLKVKNYMKVHPGSPNKHLHIATQVICSNEEFPVGVTESNSGKCGSPLVDRNIYELSLAKLNQSTPSKEASKSPSSLKKRAEIPSKEQLHNAHHTKDTRLAGEDLPSLTFSLNGSIEHMQNQGSILALSQISQPNTVGITQLKRKAEDDDDAVTNSSAQRSLKVQRSTQHILHPASDNPYETTGAICPVDREKIVNWNEIPGKVSLEINQLFAPLTDKLNPRLICKLEDNLAHLKKVHLCGMLCFQIKSQNVYDESSVARTIRRAENRSLLCKIAYEKAKLQLLHLKQETQQKKARVVTSGIQELEILKLECSKLMHRYGEGYGQVTSGCYSIGSVNPETACEVTNSKGTKITHEIKVLDSKIKNLVKSFHMCHKMTGEQRFVDITAMIEDILKKKMHKRLILQDIQYWKVDSLNNRKDNHSIVLNYSGFINQRLTLKPGSVPCVLMSNSLNDAVIRMYFPNMNALVASESLFSAEYTKKYFASKTLAEETQKTSLALHNLLDVAEELQLARMELRNLVQGNFDSPSAEQLHLQITFADYGNCRKVIMFLDMACLTLGHYPGDIVPCKLLEASPTGAESSLSDPILTEIKSGINDLGVGYPRVLRLCRCVSRVLQC